MTTAKPDQVRATSSATAAIEPDDVVSHHYTWYDPDAATFDEFEPRSAAELDDPDPDEEIDPR